MLFVGHISVLYAVGQIADDQVDLAFLKKSFGVYGISGDEFKMLFLVFSLLFLGSGETDTVPHSGKRFVGAR